MEPINQQAQPTQQAPVQNSSFAAPITNPMQQQAQPNVSAQPATQGAVAKTYMTRDEYIAKFGDDAGFLEPGAWEQKKKAREGQYNPESAELRAMRKQISDMNQMLSGFVKQTTTKDLGAQYTELYKQQQAAFSANNIPEANRIEQEKLKIAAAMANTTQGTPAQQQQQADHNDPDKLAANAYLMNTDWANDPVKFEHATAIYAHINTTRPDLSEIQKVVEVDRRVKSLGVNTQAPVMGSQGVMPNPPQQQFNNGEKNFNNLPQAAKDGFNQLKAFRTDISPEIYAKNWYLRNQK